MSRFLEYLVKNARPLTWVMLALMALLVIADVFIPTGYGRFPFDSIGGFGALYGFVSCVLIIVVSKLLGYAFLYRSEDYYDDALPDGRPRAGAPEPPEKRDD
ncbi:MAG: hypothetical protein KFF45_09630 [Thioalkalivibrio sp.]|nr:hypothetical protein [Thioalkalivibrio sp.]